MAEPQQLRAANAALAEMNGFHVVRQQEGPPGKHPFIVSKLTPAPTLTRTSAAAKQGNCHFDEMDSAPLGSMTNSDLDQPRSRFHLSLVILIARLTYNEGSPGSGFDESPF